MTFRLLISLVFFSSVAFGVSTASAERYTLVESEDDIGYTLDEEWRRWWRRISDRGGRYEPAGPIQQRFPIRQYPTHQSDMATAEYPIGDEALWARSTDGARWWVHSYNAVQLGNNVSMKMGRRIGPKEKWRYDIRYDRLYTRDTWSDLVQADFTWQPKEDRTPFFVVSVFPRIEKQDSDLAFTLGYKDSRFGEARLRLWALDPFSSAAYAVATGRGSPLDYLWKNTSVPIAVAAELSSVRIGGLRSELYLGAVIPQSRELYTEELAYVRKFDESAALFGGLLEYKFDKMPLWIGVASTMVSSHFEEENVTEPEKSTTFNETNLQARLYALSVPRKDMRLEGYWRLTARPEEIITVEDPTSYRKDYGSMFSLRWQWLLARTTGFELSYWRFDRKTEGPPDMNVDGTGHRFATRMLWHMKDLTATFGVGWDPANAGLYDGAGGTFSVKF